jgi:hypothetical protein
MILIVLFLLLRGGLHWIADLPLQTTKMRLGKSKSWRILASHVAVYTVALMIGTFTAVLAVLPWSFVLAQFWWVITLVVIDGILNGAIHFGVDAFTSRKTGALWTMAKYAEKRIRELSEERDRIIKEHAPPPPAPMPDILAVDGEPGLTLYDTDMSLIIWESELERAYNTFFNWICGDQAIHQVTLMVTGLLIILKGLVLL